MTSSLFFSIFGVLLPTFFAQTQPTQNWITIAIGIVLILAFIGLLVWFYTTGKLQQWYQAGTQSGRWRIQDLQLSNEAKKIEKVKTVQIEELGQKAWQSKVSDPNYAQGWADIEAVGTQIDRIREHSRSLQDNLNRLSTEREEVVINFDNQISQVELQRKETETKLKQAQSSLRQLESDIDSLASEKSSLQREIKATRTDLINTEGSDEPDRDEILGNLKSRLDDLVSQLLEVSNDEPELAGRIPGFQSEVLALNTRVNELSDQVRNLEGQKEQELEPLDLQLEALEKQLRTKSEEIKDLEQKMEPMIKSLGYQVDTARPASEALQENYSQLDATYQKLADNTQERTEIDANLGELDMSASRNFYLLIGLGLVVLVLGILLITGVL
ncbi:MAG: hypothetical protein PHW11_03585 [Anaerolineaceae bacterium]|jgi:chromosome segregation ATPase|nr:hypothetical protein [Anaerolineaceae bacterium]MDD4042702.1 hypothetical protein [Anaerolineaceae bacterium]MDD4577089.1 hypothetical protein [Anaerolineaceae bacterium]